MRRLPQPLATLLLTFTLLSASCSPTEKRKAQAIRTSEEILAIFDDLFEAAKLPRGERRIDRELGKTSISASTDATDSKVIVIRTETLRISSTELDLKKLTEAIRSVPPKLQAIDFNISPRSETLSGLPQPQFYMDEISRDGFSGVLLITASPPLNDYLTITAIAVMNYEE